MSLIEQVHRAGFHRLASMPTQLAVAEAPQLAELLADVPRVLVVGNDVALWPLFVADYLALTQLRALEHPLDAWVEQRLAPLVDDRPIFYAHRQYDGSYLPMQRFAVAAHLGSLSKAQLVVHPVVGPWISLRAIVGLHASDGVVTPTASGLACENDGCEAGLAELLLNSNSTWRDWYELRAQCSVPAKEWRFSDEQVLYHYTKDRSVIGTDAKLPPR